MLRRALRLMWGTAALVAGGWVVRALGGVPSALGAGPVDINAVAANSSLTPGWKTMFCAFRWSLAFHKDWS